MATMKPPIAPAIMGSPTDCIASSGDAPKKRLQVHAAVATHKITSRPVLLTAPETVMLSPP